MTSRRLPTGSTLLAVAGLLAACGGPGLGALSGKTPTQILSTSIDAAEKQAGVHYELHATTGSSTQSISGDAGVSEGEQEVETGNDVVQVELIGGTAYVQANSGGLQYLGLSSSVASTYAEKWISVSSSDSLYQPITEAVTLSGIFGQLKPTGTLRTGQPVTVDGHRVVAVIGNLPGQVASGVTGAAEFYVSLTSPNLPLAFYGEAKNKSSKVTDVGAFADWGESLALVAPSGAVPYSSLPTS